VETAETIDIEKLQKTLKPFLGPARAGRRFTPPVGSVRVKDLVRAGRLDAIRTDLGLLIDPESIERYERERGESGR
jgi:hypothetical protein